MLESHRGWDPGAVDLALGLARSLDVPLIAHRVTRLLVDANRSAGHPRVFSEYTRGLEPEEREDLMTLYHDLHWSRVEAAVDERIADHESVIHVSVHSFAPILQGRRRDVDVGVLYDPGRTREADWARGWLKATRSRLPRLRVLANRPYRGVSDGLTTRLRLRYPERVYSGLELEVSQGLLRDPASAESLSIRLSESLLEGGRDGASSMGETT